MDQDMRMYILLAAVAGGYLTLMTALLRRFLRPPTLRLFYALSVVEIVLAFIFVPLLSVDYQKMTFWEWFLHPSSELAAVGVYSAAQYLVLALTALTIGWRGGWPRAYQRLYWFLLTAVFAYLFLDEYFALHETVLLWRFLFPLSGTILVGLTLAAFWFGFRKDGYVLAFMLLGLGMMGFAGVGLDAFSNEHTLDLLVVRLDWFTCSSDFLGIGCWMYGVFEEFLEMAGVTLILVTLVSYARARIPEGHWRLLRRWLGGGAALWVFLAASNLWFLPTLEGLILPRPLHVTYEGTPLTMVGYTTSREVAAPGDTLDLAVYFRTDRTLDATYNLSVHVLTHPEVESLTQYDVQLGNWEYPSTAWVPGFTVRNTVHLVLPEELPPLPASFWIMARVWKARENPGGGEATLEGLTVAEAERPLITPDSLLLFSLPVLADAPAPEPPVRADYRFEGGLTLAGFSLPETATLGEETPLAFWWQTGASPAVDLDLTQFIHLFHANRSDYWVHDRQPFDSRFPTSDWPPDMTAVDAFSITLPEDLPPGQYQVHTGLYEPVNFDRVPATDAAGQPVVDHSIVLGTITVGR